MNYIHQYHTEPQIIHNRKIDFVPHLHDEIEIISVFGGSATLTADGYSYNVSKGDFIILFPNIIHSYSHEKNIRTKKTLMSESLSSARTQSPNLPRHLMISVRKHLLSLLALPRARIFQCLPRKYYPSLKLHRMRLKRHTYSCLRESC